MMDTNSAFVLIKRAPRMRFSVATVDYIDIETYDLDLNSSAPTKVSNFLHEMVEADDLQAMMVYGCDDTEVACIWFDKNRNPNPDSVSAVLGCVSSGAIHYLCGNILMTGPGHDDGILDFLDPSRASIFADGLNASQTLHLCPNSTMRIYKLPLKRGPLLTKPKRGFN